MLLRNLILPLIKIETMNTSTYLITFTDGSIMNLDWSSNLITTKELEVFLNKVSIKYDILKFNKVK